MRESTPLIKTQNRPDRSYGAIGSPQTAQRVTSRRRGAGRAHTLSRSNSLPTLSHNSVISVEDTGVHIHRHTPSKFDWTANHAPTWREKLAFFLDTSSAGRWWKLIDAVVNFAWIILYIWGTSYEYERKGDSRHHRPLWLEDTDSLIALVIVLQHLLAIVLDPIGSFFTFHFALTILSTGSVLWAFAVRDMDEFTDTYFRAGDAVLLFPFRFWRFHFSIMELVGPSPNFFINPSPVTQKVATVVLAIVDALATVTAFVHLTLYLKHNHKRVSFFDVFYSITVSATSGLATDIIPDNSLSRTVVLGVVIVGVVYIPSNLAELLLLLRSKSEYDAPNIPPSEKSPNPYILLTGHLDFLPLKQFLKEMYSSDHGPITKMTSMVILAPGEPDEALEGLLRNPRYSMRVKYVKGSPLSFRSLSKAGVTRADTAFIFARPSSFEGAAADDEDAKNTMIALSLKKFKPNIRIFVEVLDPQNVWQFEPVAEQTICIDELKMGFLANNAVAPGFLTLQYLLTTTVSDNLYKRFARSRAFQTPEKSWMLEYLRGGLMEFYQIKLSPHFEGLTFPQVSFCMHEAFEAMLVAVDDPATSEVLLSPIHYIMLGGEQGYVIASSLKVAKKLESAMISVESIPTGLVFERGKKSTSPPFASPRHLATDPDPTSPSPFTSPRQRAMGSNPVSPLMGGISSPAMSPPMSPIERIDGPSVPPSLAGFSTVSSIGPGGIGTLNGVGLGLQRRTSSNLLLGVIQEAGVSRHPEQSGLSDDETDSDLAPGSRASSPRSLSTSPLRRTKSVPFRTSTNIQKESLTDSPMDIELENEQERKLSGEDLTVPKTSVDFGDGKQDGSVLASRLGASNRRSLTDQQGPSRSNSAKPMGRDRMYSGVSVGRAATFASGNASTFVAASATPSPASGNAIPADLTRQILLAETTSFPSNLLAFLDALYPPLSAFSGSPAEQRFSILDGEKKGTSLVILSPQSPSQSILQIIEREQLPVYFVSGSPLNRRDLRLARVHKALRIVITSSGVRGGSAISTSAPLRTIDAPVALAYHNVKALARREAYISCELFHGENVRLIADSVGTHHSEFQDNDVSPGFDGRVLLNSMMHSILCQTYYNPALLRLLYSIVFNTASADFLPSPSPSSPSLAEMGNPAQTGQVYQKRAPAELVGAVYSQLMHYFLTTEGAIAIGLFRRTTANIEYVVVNPKTTDVIFEGDKVFLLGGTS